MSAVRVPGPGDLVLVTEDIPREARVVRVVSADEIEVQFAPGLKRVVRVAWCQNLSARWVHEEVS